MPRTSAVHAVTTLGIDMGKNMLHMIGLDTGIAMGLPARADLVLRFGPEIAGIMSLVQLFFRRPAGAVDHSPTLNGRAFADFFRPACQVFIFVRLQKRARVVVGGAIQHAAVGQKRTTRLGVRVVRVR
jgi:hypothetical protein